MINTPLLIYESTLIVITLGPAIAVITYFMWWANTQEKREKRRR